MEQNFDPKNSTIGKHHEHPDHQQPRTPEEMYKQHHDDQPEDQPASQREAYEQIIKDNGPIKMYVRIEAPNNKPHLPQSSGLVESLAYYRDLIKYYYRCLPYSFRCGLHRFIRRTIEAIVVILLVHLLMQPSGTPIDFAVEWFGFLKELFGIIYNYVISIFKNMFTFNIAEVLNIIRDAIRDVLDVGVRYHNWLFDFFVG